MPLMINLAQEEEEDLLSELFDELPVYDDNDEGNRFDELPTEMVAYIMNQITTPEDQCRLADAYETCMEAFLDKYSGDRDMALYSVRYMSDLNAMRVVKTLKVDVDIYDADDWEDLFRQAVLFQSTGVAKWIAKRGLVTEYTVRNKASGQFGPVLAAFAHGKQMRKANREKKRRRLDMN